MFCAAIDDPRIPKPITCYSTGSPKVGTIGFRKAFQSLEESGKLRCVRIMNEHDPVPSLPCDPSASASVETARYTTKRFSTAMSVWPSF
mmetsp:Transcript_24012/g.70849  ORF Transcript_24012/g.70849 Transcript_24012/m.70849 type:complete len:89 (+) Transcript_24012:967-1233(+)